MSDQHLSREAAPYEQIILFGDSQTQGSARNRWIKQEGNDKETESKQTKIKGSDKVKISYRQYGFCFAAALQNVYTRQFDVIIRGFNGYNTDQASAIFPKFMPKYSQAKVRLLVSDALRYLKGQVSRVKTIFFGANDSMLPGQEGSQFVALEKYKKNLDNLVGHKIIEEHNPHILLITPPPVIEDQLEGAGRGSRTATNTKKYVDACKEVAENSRGRAEVLDLWKTIMDEIDWTENGGPLPGSKGHPVNHKLNDYFSDGLHLNDNGYLVLFAAITGKINEKWPDMNLEFINDPLPVRQYREVGNEVELEDNITVGREHWVFPLWNDRKVWSGS